MIVFQTTSWQWNLTDKGISFNEKSPFFSDVLEKNYTFPFKVSLTENIPEEIALVILENIVQFKERIYGSLIRDNEFFDAYISINEIQGNEAELTIFYGKETLKVFDKKLNELPFPVVFATPNLKTYAKNKLTQSWPQTDHNFVKVFRPDIKTKSNYEGFENFVNNYKEDNGTWDFIENSNETIEGEITAVNRNVMAPMLYLIEILRVGFKTEGLEIRGDFVNDLFNHKIITVPKNYLEVFSPTQYDNYSFSQYTFQEQLNNQTVNVYKRVHTPTNIGSFSLKMKVNFSNVVAQYFQLTVKQDNVTLFSAQSQNQEVYINETLDIAITDGSIFNDIIVELRILQQATNIAPLNNFTYEYKEGNLNVFPTHYALADFVPKITFRELINKLKKWLNLKFDYTENAVYINYLEKHITQLTFANHSHLEKPNPKRTLNTNNLFKLTYPNEETVLINKDGQTYNESDFIDAEVTEIKIDVLPLTVKERFNNITAIYPEDDKDLMFVLYDGLVNGNNTAVSNINNEKLTLQQVHDKHHKKWLQFRANAMTYTDSYYAHYTDVLDILNGIYKYQKNHLVTSVKRKRLLNQHYKVDIKMESF